MKVTKADLLPLKAVLLYISIGVSLSFFGSIEYYEYDKLSVFLYIASFLILFTLGYLRGAIAPSKPRTQDRSSQKLFNNILFWVKLCIFIMFIVQLITLITSVASGGLNLSISKMGEAYANSYDGYVRGTGNISFTFLIQTLTYMPYLVSLILGVFYYKHLPKKYKIMLFFVYISIVLIETIGHGKQKQFGDLLIFLLTTWLLKNNLSVKKIRKKIIRKVSFFALLGASGLVFILSFRYIFLNIDTNNINEKLNSSIQFNTDHWIFTVFPDSIAFPLTVFSGYLSQGYYGLSLALQQPFEWTYFVGNSYSMSVLLNRYFNLPVDFHDTYPYRTSLVTSWDDTKWSTVFTWYAGDFTFIGTLLFFSLVAFFYAKVWHEAYKYKNPISIILFSMLTIALLYIPANNQLMHTPGSVIAVFIFIILWLLKHKKYNIHAY